MKFVDALEHWLERKIDGFFAKRFQEEVQPIEIGQKLIREMEQAKTVSVSKTYVPDTYDVFLSQHDFEKMQPFLDELKFELQPYLAKHGAKENYLFLRPVTIAFFLDEQLLLGAIQVNAKFTEAMPGDVLLGELVVLAGPDKGKIFSLEEEVMSIGRRMMNEIRLDDANVSRIHAQIVRQEKHFLLSDEGSTNGLLVNGKKVKEWVLQNKDIIEIGSTTLLFKVV